MENIYTLLLPLKSTLKKAYRLGASLPCTLFRDLDICHEFQQMKVPFMERYSILSERYKISEKRVQQIIIKYNQNE